MRNNNSKSMDELKSILRLVGPENIWRPLITPDNQILYDGTGDEDDGILNDINTLDFQGKTVVDFGCNLGYYSFIVKKIGAASVMGIDNDERIIRACNIIKRMYHTGDIKFQALDMTSMKSDLMFDIGMMIDFIGKNSVITGMLPKFLDALERVSRKEMILTLRPVYQISKHLQNDTQALLDKYTKKYVRKGCFLNMKYVTDRFRQNWEIERISGNNNKEVESKQTVLFRRISK